MATKTKYEYFEDMVEQLKRIAEYLSVIAKAEYLNSELSSEKVKYLKYGERRPCLYEYEDDYDYYRRMLKGYVDDFKDER